MGRTYATPAAVIVISILFPVLGTLTVALRFFIRRNAKISLWIDDWLTIPALYTLAGLLIWGAVTKSLGDLLPPPNVSGPEGYLFSDSSQQIRLQQYLFDFIGVFDFGLLKLSILFFYRKIFCTSRVSRSTFNIATTVMIVLVIMWTLTFGIGAIFLCRSHPKEAWAPVAVVAVKCSAQLPFLEGYAISDFIMDVLIWSLPIPMIWSLHMTTSRKAAVAAVFLVGLLTIGASAARMAIYIKYIVNAFAQSDGETLITYLLFWTMIECGLGVIVVCLPSLRSLLGTSLLGSLISSIRNAFTLRSLRSRTGSEPMSVRLDSRDHKASTGFSRPSLRAKEEGYTETAISGQSDVEDQHGTPQYGIQVTNRIEQF